MRATYPYSMIAIDHSVSFMIRSLKWRTELGYVSRTIFWDMWSLEQVYSEQRKRLQKDERSVCLEGLEKVKKYGMINYLVSYEVSPDVLNKIAGQNKRATMAYRPGANATAVRIVLKITLDIKCISQM